MSGRFLRAAALILFASVLLAGCGGSQKWDTTNITGVMPNLKFTLTDDNGATVHADKWSGKVKLLYFGYTHCPDICPLTLADIARALRSLGKQADGVRVLFVSVDPKRDTPAMLKTYAHAFGSQFVGLTGTQNQLRALTARYRVSYSYDKPDADGNYTVNHGAVIFVFDQSGRVRLLMSGSDKSAAIAHDLKQLLD
ncbi:MAG: SCO family protein [Gammaproteobacteria bacterium]